VPLDATVELVTKSIETLKLNTGVAALMSALNEIEKSPTVAQNTYATFITLLYPYAPHLASELAETHRVDLTTWPTYDAAVLTSTPVIVAVQVNGRVRARIELAPHASEKEALAAGRAAAGKWLATPEKRAVYVPGKIINFVI
jgi:leucyl-tRNA synthetase